jgi:hypothetical protein
MLRALRVKRSPEVNTRTESLETTEEKVAREERVVKEEKVLKEEKADREEKVEKEDNTMLSERSTTEKDVSITVIDPNAKHNLIDLTKTDPSIRPSATTKRTTLTHHLRSQLSETSRESKSESLRMTDSPL